MITNKKRIEQNKSIKIHKLLVPYKILLNNYTNIWHDFLYHNHFIRKIILN